MKYILLLLLATSCMSENFSENITIEQIESDYQVEIRKSPKTGKIFRVFFYIAFEIHKKRLSEIRLCGDAGYYGGIIYETPWDRISMYSEQNDTLIFESKSENRFLSFKPQKYIAKPSHDIDSCQQSQSLFLSYLARMKAGQKDTLHIGTIEELKQSNPKLLENLLQGDSIEFDFYCDGYYSVKMPIEIK